MDNLAISGGDRWMGITSNIRSANGNWMDTARTIRKKAQAVALAALFITSTTQSDIHGSRASFLMVDDGWMTLNYLHPNAEKQRIRDNAIANGDTHIYIYSRNVGDNFGSKNKSTIINPQPDWEAQLDTLNDAGLSPIIWLTPDDSTSITSQSTAAQAAHFSEVVRRFDSKVSGYVACLECDEYWSAAKTNALVAHLKTITDKPIGVHLTTGIGGRSGNKEYYANADYVFLQFGWDKTPAEVTAMVKQAMAVTGKPVVASEYSKESRTAAARALGDAACLAGAIGTGNGRSIQYCGQQEKKKSWIKKNETTLIGITTAAIGIYMVSKTQLPIYLRASDNGYLIGINQPISENASISFDIDNTDRITGRFHWRF